MWVEMREGKLGQWGVGEARVNECRKSRRSGGSEERGTAGSQGKYGLGKQGKGSVSYGSEQRGK